MAPPTVSVVVPTFQRACVVERTLRALCALDYPAQLLELLVVDDGSTDSTGDVVASFARVRGLRQPNLGVAAARNAGAREAKGEVLMFVDDDIIVAPSNIRRHLDVRRTYGDCIVAGRAQLDPDVRASLSTSPFGRFRLWTEDTFQQAEAIKSASDGPVEALTVASGNMSISRHLFWQLGGFDDRFPVGAEDQDLCWRAHQAGAAIVRDDRIRVVHNDQHADLRGLSAREERGAVGLVYLARKHPDFPAPDSLLLNGPLRRNDPPRLAARKLLRSAMSSPISLAVAHRLIRGVEVVRPHGGWPLDYLYRAVTGLHVFRGMRRGFQLTATEHWPAAHDTLRARAQPEA